MFVLKSIIVSIIQKSWIKNKPSLLIMGTNYFCVPNDKAQSKANITSLIMAFRHLIGIQK